ncbi:hypothetical protein BDQ17DRAFT_1418909 [Cyathus striatus]|nr:hypothetical protein BDQ17DRAFT_1418909 [Cyathus striatus]
MSFVPIPVLRVLHLNDQLVLSNGSSGSLSPRYASVKMLLVVVLSGFLIQAVLGQTSNAVCLPYYQWAFNTQNKSPCEVASSLLAICNNNVYEVLALPDQSHYQGPSISDANPCQCNTVTYALMSACGACQGRTYLSWSSWSANCPNVSIGVFPTNLPTGILVPGWAYENVTANDMFDQSFARDHANATESSARPPASTSAVTITASHSISSITSSSTSVQTSALSTQTVADTSSTASPTSNLAHADAVGAGAVVGCIGGLALMGAVMYWLLRWRRKSNLHLIISSSNSSRDLNVNNQSMSQYQSSPIRPVEHSA